VTVETCLAIGSGLAAFVSAVLWILAARARAPHKSGLDQDGWQPATISVDGDDFIATVQRQGELNRWAAYAAALAAFLQGVSVIVSVIRA
jgi:hypothetical protein